jgi:arginine exporter protein ArgO
MPQKDGPSQADKWKYTLLTTVILLAVFNPQTYLLTDSLLGGLIGSLATNSGCPTWLGFGVHVVVFTLLLRGVMEVPI